MSERKLVNRLVLASNNRGKIKELKEILENYSFKKIEILTLEDFNDLQDIEETGESFEENARLKAEEVSKITGYLTLADDSGLEVEVLNGKPGVYSARYSGEGASDEENNKKLLEELKEVPWNERRGSFRCVIAIAHPRIKTRYVEGKCDGFIVEKEVGAGGFGYDPLFFDPEKGKTFAEMSSEEKIAVSHRGKALKKLGPVLEETIKYLEFLEEADEDSCN